MKVAPIVRALAARGHEAVLVHTGQHYDQAMSQAFFDDLGIPEPDYNLGVGSGSHARQTAAVMDAFEPVFVDVRPRWVVVVGDVNSTLACALVTAKLRHESGAALAHVEAGLRSGDWTMPEEVNRVLTDRLSDLLLTPSRDALSNLVAEGIEERRIRFVGNVMIDTLYAKLDDARKMDLPTRLGFRRGRYCLVTVHRPSNVDSVGPLREIVAALGQLTFEMEVVLPLHPRTRKAIEALGLDAALSGVKVLAPLGYTEMLSLMDGASVVLTDSGGVQEETTALGIPCVTLREQTERPITVLEGTNRLAKWPLTAPEIVRTAREASADVSRKSRAKLPEGWDGNAASRIVDALVPA